LAGIIEQVRKIEHLPDPGPDDTEAPAQSD